MSTPKTFSLTKKEIIQAINTEPLGAKDREWCTTGPSKKSCKVCAVGAVVRFLGQNRKSAAKLLLLGKYEFDEACRRNARGNAAQFLRGVVPTDADVLQVQTNTGPLQALSSYYEVMTDNKVRMSKIRATLANYVQNNFPARTEITVSL